MDGLFVRTKLQARHFTQPVTHNKGHSLETYAECIQIWSLHVSITRMSPVAEEKCLIGAYGKQNRILVLLRAIKTKQRYCLRISWWDRDATVLRLKNVCWIEIWILQKFKSLSHRENTHYQMGETWKPRWESAETQNSTSGGQLLQTLQEWLIFQL